jgi:glycosyltransferase involved in cell wall biosynthesis
MNSPSISVIIPVHNDPKNLRQCLRALAESTLSNYECIVVDDGSSDDTLDVARQFQVKVLGLAERHGPAFARNHGAAAASAEILFFIDADIVIYPDTLAKVEAAFSARPEIDAVIGSYDDSPGDLGFISQYKNMFHHYVHQNSKKNACTFWSGCGAIRREVFAEYGGFSVSYGRPAIEDIELGFRLTRDGHKIILQKDIQVKHLKHWSFWGLLKTDIFDRGVPWTLIMLRDRKFPKDLNLQVSQRICVVFVYLLLLSPLLAIIIHPAYLIMPLVILLAIVIINLKFYEFYVQKRGIVFAIKVIPMHILYFIYSGISIVLGTLAYLSGKKTV